MPKPASTTTRGYGAAHQQIRARLLADLRRNPGQTCWRCGQPIAVGQLLDLGHDDHDRTVYRGLEHRHCNRAAGATLGNRRRRWTRRGLTPPRLATPLIQPPTSRRW